MKLPRRKHLSINIVPQEPLTPNQKHPMWDKNLSIIYNGLGLCGSTGPFWKGSTAVCRGKFQNQHHTQIHIKHICGNERKKKEKRDTALLRMSGPTVVTDRQMCPRLNVLPSVGKAVQGRLNCCWKNIPEVKGITWWKKDHLYQHTPIESDNTSAPFEREAAWKKFQWTHANVKVVLHVGNSWLAVKRRSKYRNMKFES